MEDVMDFWISTQITKNQSLDLDNFPKDAIVKQPPVEQPLRRDNLYNYLPNQWIVIFVYFATGCNWLKHMTLFI